MYFIFSNGTVINSEGKIVYFSFSDPPAELPISQRGDRQANPKEWYGKIFDKYEDSVKTQVSR